MRSVKMMRANLRNGVRQCSIEGCVKPTRPYTLLCSMHYLRKWRHGSPRVRKTSENYNHPLRPRWWAMVERCTKPYSPSWRNYGGRGIKVCKRWLKFENFLRDMVGFAPGMSLDRVDNCGDYRPENVRWATRSQQASNTRKTRWITHNGQRLPLREWAKICGIQGKTLWSRIYQCGWSVERALTEPLRTWPSKVSA